MKKFITAITVAIMILATTACSSGYDNSSRNNSFAESEQLIKDLHTR